MIKTLAACAAAVALAGPVAAQDSSHDVQAPTGPLYLLGEGVSGANWFAEPTELEPGVWRVWSWLLLAQASEHDGFDRVAFLNEYHCASGEVRRLRDEQYAGDRLMAAYDSDSPPLPPLSISADVEMLPLVCQGRLPEVTTPDVAAAMSRLRD